MLIFNILVMADSKLNEELEEQDFSSFYRVDVYRQNIMYAMLDPKNPKDQKYIPFSGKDYFAVEKFFSVYTLDQKQVFEQVKKIVEQVKKIEELDDSPFIMRVYKIPLNSRVIDDEAKLITVFKSKGAMVENPEHERFKAGEIVEYLNLTVGVVGLAVVYEPPKIEEVCEPSEDSDIELRDLSPKDYKLITVEGILFPISASCVSRPSFPVAEAFKEKLENVYEKKLEEGYELEDLLAFL